MITSICLFIIFNYRSHVHTQSGFYKSPCKPWSSLQPNTVPQRFILVPPASSNSDERLLPSPCEGKPRHVAVISCITTKAFPINRLKSHLMKQGGIRDGQLSQGRVYKGRDGGILEVGVRVSQAHTLSLPHLGPRRRRGEDLMNILVHTGVGCFKTSLKKCCGLADST